MSGERWEVKTEQNDFLNESNFGDYVVGVEGGVPEPGAEAVVQKTVWGTDRFSLSGDDCDPRFDGNTGTNPK